MKIFPITTVVTCKRGARILVRGDYDPASPIVSVIPCPVHGDKITIRAGWPPRHWSYIRTLSEGSHAMPYSSQHQSFYREQEGAEAYQRIKYRRRHRIK